MQVGAINVSAEAEERAIRDIVDAFMDAWNRHDMKAHTSAFADDADFVDVSGNWLRGRQQICEEQGRRHALRFMQSTVRTLSTTVRFIRPDVAIVHHSWEMEGDAGPDAARNAVRRGIFTFLMSRDGARWVFEAAHNTDTK